MQEVYNGEPDSGDGDPDAADDSHAASGESPCAAGEGEIAEEDGPEEALPRVGYDVWQMDEEDEEKEHYAQESGGQSHVARQGQAGG